MAKTNTFDSTTIGEDVEQYEFLNIAGGNLIYNIGNLS